MRLACRNSILIGDANRIPISKDAFWENFKMNNKPLVWEFNGQAGEPLLTKSNYRKAVNTLVTAILDSDQEVFLGLKQERNNQKTFGLPLKSICKNAALWPGTIRFGGTTQIFSMNASLTRTHWKCIPKTNEFYDADPFLYFTQNNESHCLLATTGHEYLIWYMEFLELLDTTNLKAIKMNRAPVVDYVPDIVKARGRICGR